MVFYIIILEFPNSIDDSYGASARNNEKIPFFIVPCYTRLYIKRGPLFAAGDINYLPRPIIPYLAF